MTLINGINMYAYNQLKNLIKAEEKIKFWTFELYKFIMETEF